MADSVDPTSARCPPGYELVRQLGIGGFGEVMLARNNALGRLVAIKYLRRQVVADRDVLDRFKREAVVMASINAPTVVQVLDVRFDDPDPAIILEYVAGEALDDLLVRDALSVSEKLTVLSDVATALETVAAKAIVHRDVKPANVFVLPNGRAKLGDFGLARIAASQDMFRTAAQSIAGTPAYLPPEIARCSGEPDERSDAYSFAVMAYEILTGRLPFVDRGLVGIIAAHAFEPPPHPATITTGFPAQASEALLEALDKNPDRRPLPAELVQRLTAVPSEQWPAHIRKPSRRADERTLRLPTAASETSLQARRSRSKPKYNRRYWQLGALLVLATSVGVTVATTFAGAKPHPHMLTVTNVSVGVTTPVQRCPQATWIFTADVTTNGAAGSLTTRWLRPDGQPTPEQARTEKPGERNLRFELRYTIKGRRPLQGTASLEILRPQRLTQDSSPVRYTCVRG